MSFDIDKLNQLVDAVYDETVQIRRNLHMHPELSEQEEKTAEAVCRRLDELGIEYTAGIAGHGISAVIYGRDRDHGVGIRADMDALPITERTDCSF